MFLSCIRKPLICYDSQHIYIYNRREGLLCTVKCRLVCLLKTDVDKVAPASERVNTKQRKVLSDVGDVEMAATTQLIVPAAW